VTEALPTPEMLRDLDQRLEVDQAGPAIQSLFDRLEKGITQLDEWCDVAPGLHVPLPWLQTSEAPEGCHSSER